MLRESEFPWRLRGLKLFESSVTQKKRYLLQIEMSLITHVLVPLNVDVSSRNLGYAFLRDLVYQWAPKEGKEIVGIDSRAAGLL